MTLYDNIDSLLREDIPYTGEGFIWKQLELKQINIRRFLYGISIIRNNNKIEQVVS